MDRREFMIKAGVTSLGISLLPVMSFEKPLIEKSTLVTSPSNPDQPEFTLPDLGYDYRALEPYIDARTMEIHHNKHHAGYVRKLNSALEKHPLNGKKLKDIVMSVTKSEEDEDVLNNAGGHYNHTLFWEIMKPGGSKMPVGKLATEIVKQFGSYEKFKSEFTKAASKVFGSGWAWLAMDQNKKLFIAKSANQENPLMQNIVSRPGMPILGIDVWEHAYYLKYQNKRSDYIDNFMKLLNWDVLDEKCEGLF